MAFESLLAEYSSLSSPIRQYFGRYGWTSFHFQIALAAAFVIAFVGSVIFFANRKPKIAAIDYDNGVLTYLRFVYASFLKPHENSGDGGQQSALESFYKTQVWMDCAVKPKNIYTLPHLKQYT